MLVRLRPPLRTAAICLALGAVVTVAVAWACVLQTDPLVAMLTMLDETDSQAVPPDDLQRLRAHPHAQSFSDAEVWLSVERLPCVERRVASMAQYWQVAAARAIPYPLPGHLVNELSTRVRAGWPCAALEGERWINPERTDQWNEGTWTPQTISDIYDHRWLLPAPVLTDRNGTIRLKGPSFRYPHLLPLKPMWPGFAINTVLFGSLVWLALFGPFSLRRLVRRRRGLCARCAYPRGESDVCTECGTTLPLSLAPHRG